MNSSLDTEQFSRLNMYGYLIGLYICIIIQDWNSHYQMINLILRSEKECW